MKSSFRPFINGETWASLRQSGSPLPSRGRYFGHCTPGSACCSCGPERTLSLRLLFCNVKLVNTVASRQMVAESNPGVWCTFVVQIPFLEAAKTSALTFWHDEQFQSFLRDAGVLLRPGSTRAEPAKTHLITSASSLRRNSITSNLQRITCGGFSIGGPTAFYMAALLASHVDPESTLATLGSRVRTNSRDRGFPEEGRLC